MTDKCEPMWRQSISLVYWLYLCINGDGFWVERNGEFWGFICLK